MKEKVKRDEIGQTIDEGWWDSVLAEECRFSTPTKADAPKEAARDSDSEALKENINWDEVKALYSQDQIIELTVSGCNRGGLLVEGKEIFGFVPFSHLIELAGKETLDRKQDLETYVGRSLRLKIIECAPQDGRVVLSERAAQAEAGKRSKLFHSLCAGQKARGVVTNITDFGAFVDLGGVEGLIHISELSWGRAAHPSQYVRLGDEIEVQVLDLAPERCRVALSLKRMTPNPWENAESKFPVGSLHNATVVSLLSYGAFVRLDQFGVEGLIHASEMPLKANAPLKDFLREGQALRVRVLQLDAAQRRLGFSMRIE
ncbi:MAG: S1 RNA-binding domain-containing protein [Anaerolineales bacterium]|nr:S1 RNA-binding domain-containing protein [Anaerolineales bacterium]